MKVSIVVATALLSCMLMSPAQGQTLKHPTSVKPVSLNYDNYDSYYDYYDYQEEPSPSDLKPKAKPQAQVQPTPGRVAEPGAYDPCCDACCDPLGGDGCVGSCCGCSDFLWGDGVPFTLFSQCNRFGVAVNFWTQIGYHTEGANGFGTGFFNNYPNRVQLQQQWLSIGRAANGACGLDWGFHVDMLYGTDGQDLQAFGGRPNDWDNDWNHGFAYGWAIPQLYGELAVGNLNVKLGKFFTIVGYEVAQAPQNFFYSHSFSFNISEPFSHTGVLAEYGVNDFMSVAGGWGAGSDTGFSANGGSVFLGAVDLQLTENSSVTYATIMGDVGYEDTVGSDDNGYIHMIYFTTKFCEDWTFVLQSNLVDNDTFLGSPNNIFSLVKYVTYDYNDALAFGVRAEYYKDPFFGAGAAGEVGNLTFGANFRPHANMVVRPEVRWDDYHPASGLQDSTMFGVDAIITY